MSFNRTCPYCGHATTITTPNFGEGRGWLGTSESNVGKSVISWRSIACPNEKCKELTLAIELSEQNPDYGQMVPGRKLRTWQLLPRSRAKPQPSFIPQSIRDTYIEACLIANDSPRAAAAMARRCLQGIVRDFWELPPAKRGNLGAELNHIKDRVDSGTWDAIHAVRSIGDIGAHMEKDVSLIVDIEADEAELLLELIETLFVDWYVARQLRDDRNSRLKQIAADKLKVKKAAKKNGGEPEDTQ